VGQQGLACVKAPSEADGPDPGAEELAPKRAGISLAAGHGYGVGARAADRNVLRCAAGASWGCLLSGVC